MSEQDAHPAHAGYLGSLRKDDRSLTVKQYATFEMPSHGSGKRNALEVTTDRREG